MTKPKPQRMYKLGAVDEPHCIYCAYPADEMDDWLDYLEFTINGYKFSQQGDAKLIKEMKAENARLKEALEELAKQKIGDEIHNPYLDYVYAYEHMVTLARAALGKE